MINFGNVPLGAVLPVFFSTYGKTNGESITLTGLLTSDIEIYKGTSITQRASDAGYALIDTDGIDVDGITGIHAFSIDTGDNTDAGFYAAGSFYTVVVSAVTIDAQTVNFIAATFRIVAAESVAGTPEARAASLGTTAKSDVNAEVLDVLVTDTFAEPSAVPVATSSLKDKLNWLFTLGRNKITQTSTTSTLRNDADSGNVGTSTVSDDGTTATRGEWT